MAGISEGMPEEPDIEITDEVQELLDRQAGKLEKIYKEKIGQLEYETQILRDEADKQAEERERTKKQVFMRRRQEEREDQLIPPSGASMVASNLSPQLGSDPSTLATGGYDMRRLSNIEKKVLIPLIYFRMRGRRVRFWREFVNEYINLVVSIGGWRARQLIKMQRATNPGEVEPEPETPGFIGRHITDRGYKERQGD